MKGGSVGGILGLTGGTAGVLLAARRYPTIRNLTTPMKAFLVTSAGTFVGIIGADQASRSFDVQRNVEKQWYENREERLRAEELRGLSFADRAVAFARREKYKLIGATWVASMIGSFVLVGRNPYISGQQKIVQARVYAQGLTLAVLCASAAFEIADQRRGRGMLDSAKADKAKQRLEQAEPVPAPVHRDEKDESGLWKDMVAAEEERLKSKYQSLHYKHGEEGQGQGEEKKDEKEDSKEESKPEKAEGKEQA